jgi:hypothetical protein
MTLKRRDVDGGQRDSMCLPAVAISPGVSGHRGCVMVSVMPEDSLDDCVARGIKVQVEIYIHRGQSKAFSSPPMSRGKTLP